MNLIAIEPKMLLPPVPSRVEQRNHLASHGVDSCEVRTFSKIAPLAGERQIIWLVRTAVFAGNNVLDVVREGRVFLP